MPKTVVAMAMSIVAAFALLSANAHAGKVKTRIVYYTVSGATARQLHNNMTVPRGFFSSEKAAYANITFVPKFDGDIIEGKTCRLKGFRINSDFTVRLPKLAGGARLSKGLRSKFSRFVRFVTRHEYTHRRIYVGCARRAESRIRNMRSSNCASLKQKFVGVLKREWQRCSRLHARFDASERRRLNRHPLIRAARAPQRARTVAVRKRVTARRSQRRRSLGRDAR